MANVTIQSSIGHTVTVPFDSAENLLLAQQIAAGISSGVASGALEPATSDNGPPPAIPAGASGVFFQETSGLTFLPQGYDAVVNNTSGATIFGSGGEGESVLSGNGGLTFVATGGSGTVVAGGGPNEIVIPAVDKGSWLLATGAGNDTVLALGPGSDTIGPGGGHNSLGAGQWQGFAATHRSGHGRCLRRFRHD